VAIETNRQIVAEFLDLINRPHRVREAFERYVAESYIQHNPTTENGREGAISLIEKFVSMPGFRPSVKRIIAGEDMVATHMHLQLEEDDPGLAVVDIWRLENGKIVEHWDVMQKVPRTTASGNPML
jgi:predicted SnoaL-like aldol condensation-catalyzing enzyme